MGQACPANGVGRKRPGAGHGQRARLSLRSSPGALFDLLFSLSILLRPRPFPGISLKTQILYTLVFVTRYLDLATRWVSLYNTLMKCVFLGASAAILWLMTRGRGIKGTYDAAHDTFRIAFLVVPCAALAALVHADSSPLELAWTFSIYLEAVAILPQLVLLQRTGNVDNLTGDYVFLLGVYRGLYLVNWVYRAWTEPGYRQWIGKSEKRETGERRARATVAISHFSPLLSLSFHSSLDLRYRPDGPLPGLLLLLPAGVEAQREAEPAVVRMEEGERETKRMEDGKREWALRDCEREGGAAASAGRPSLPLRPCLGG